MSNALINIIYLVAAVLFILGLKGLTHPRTAVRGNLMSALGMFIAVIVTLTDQGIVDFKIILAGVVVGGAIGAIAAARIPMTSMPELVALFNGFGGGASVLIAGAALFEAQSAALTLTHDATIATAFSGIVGGVTFWGSLIAFGKLQGILPGNPVLFKGQHVLNALLVLGSVVAGAMIVIQPDEPNYYWILIAVSSLLGVMMTIPIGGADMPVVISLLNSYSGIAAASTGFVLDNNMLIIAGSLVGASGLILTSIMCKAMNRSLGNVLFGGVGAVATAGGPSADAVYEGKIKATSGDEVAMVLESARRVAIVPGYGLAVSQAQHQVRQLADLLEARGTEVIYGIHPVAGRMPGHMNVLLAEAEVPYDKLIEMDEINAMFSETDVAIVIGANDVVNPVARTDPSSPIAGMPILDVDKANTVIVIKRSLSPGFAGIPNPLFALDNSLMFFGDGKKAVNDMIAAVKDL
jgi:proton-translocating NAD(P)+ transhydrogenase subunit beta